MPQIPTANKVALFKIDGHPGWFEKITKTEAKQDGHKQHAVQALYGDGSLGFFVPVALDSAQQKPEPSPAPSPAADAVPDALPEPAAV